MRQIIQIHDCNCFFLTSHVNEDIQHAKRLFRAIIEAKLDVKLGVSFVLARRRWDDELLDLFRLAGGFFVKIGLDSGSDKMLAHMQKGYTSNDAVDLVRCCWRHGLHTIICVMFGTPGETPETVEETIAVPFLTCLLVFLLLQRH